MQLPDCLMLQVPARQSIPETPTLPSYPFKHPPHQGGGRFATFGGKKYRPPCREAFLVEGVANFLAKGGKTTPLPGTAFHGPKGRW